MARSKDGTSDGASGGGAGEGKDSWRVNLLAYQGRATRKLVREGMRAEDARDLAAAAVVVCLKRKTAPADPKAYYWKVVKRLFSDWVQHEKNRTEPLPEDLPAGGPSPLERTRENEVNEKLEEALGRLRDRPAEVARLYLIGGMSFAAIARELGLAASTVRSHWARAKETLKEDLGDFFPE